MAGNEIEKLCAKLRDRRVVSQEAEDKAAAEIERLQAEVERREEALRKIEKTRFGPEPHWSEEEMHDYWAKTALEYRAIARAALSKNTQVKDKKDET